MLISIVWKYDIKFHSNKITVFTVRRSVDTRSKLTTVINIRYDSNKVSGLLIRSLLLNCECHGTCHCCMVQIISAQNFYFWFLYSGNPISITNKHCLSRLIYMIANCSKCSVNITYLTEWLLSTDWAIMPWKHSYGRAQIQIYCLVIPTAVTRIDGTTFVS
jgi:hypothetical protein